jgi:hypothetical protein
MNRNGVVCDGWRSWADLQCQYSRGLETYTFLEILGNFADKALEGQLANEQVRALLVPNNSTESLLAEERKKRD